MFDLIINLGFDIFENLIQIIISSVISIFIFYSLNHKLKLAQTGLANIIIIITAAFLGILLPCNTYGLLPIILVLLRLGLNTYQVLPALFSNIIFNMSVPFNDPTFVFRTGYTRVLIALLIGVIAGVILMSFKKARSIMQIENTTFVPEGPFSAISIFKGIHNNINLMGIYMVCGVLINNIFNDYIMYTLTSQVASNPNTAFIPRYFAKFNVVSPGFLMALCIVFALLNFANLSAVLILLKPKGLVLFVGYYIVWVMLFGITMFF